MRLDLMSEHHTLTSDLEPTATARRAVPEPAVAMSGRPERGTPGQRRARLFTTSACAAIAAVLLCAVAVIVAGSPAQAASYRHLKSVRYGVCAYNRGDPLEDFRNQTCGSKPAAAGNWSVTLVGYYNYHPLWVLHRQAGSCLGIEGNPGDDPQLYMTCSPRGSDNVWEVFTTSSGRYVLKSFGAFQTYHRHRCLNFNGQFGYRPQLAGCSLTSSSDMIYK
jgi:hypothetical protein